MGNVIYSIIDNNSNIIVKYIKIKAEVCYVRKHLQFMVRKCSLGP